MGKKTKKVKQTLHNIGEILKNIEKTGSKMLKEMDEAEKKLNEKMSKIVPDL